MILGALRIGRRFRQQGSRARQGQEVASSHTRYFCIPSPGGRVVLSGMRGLLGFFCLIACTGQDPPHIQVDVNLVNIAFTVRGPNGALAANLSSDDFEVFEDGVRQNVSFFARSSDVPLTLGLIADFSGSQEHFLKPHHRHLEAFLHEVLSPRDRAFLICFGNHLRLASDFSASGGAILDGLKRFEHGDYYRFPELGPAEVRELGTAFYDAIYYAITEKLSGTQDGRRALILFSDGEDNSSAHDMMDAIEAAQIADTRIFALRYTERRHGRLTARNKYGIRVIERIARETGGADFDAGEGDIRASFGKIGEELRSSYELAYVSSNRVRDGSFRKVDIRAKRPGFTVRSKTGYFAR
jgi:Ca-activated chloride channel family protein